ncbi:hypothetical protein C4565_00440 [Candidatus Parcubacteria bacterium]|nr:MAG: hypothetical protein C4565_00440 [Candidatus Parcubacteria bacterium]
MLGIICLTCQAKQQRFSRKEWLEEIYAAEIEFYNPTPLSKEQAEEDAFYDVHYGRPMQQGLGEYYESKYKQYTVAFKE